MFDLFFVLLQSGIYLLPRDIKQEKEENVSVGLKRVS